MAKTKQVSGGRGKPPIGRRFTKGSVPNPKGAGAHNHDLKALKRLTHQEVADLGGIVVQGNIKALEAIKNNPESSALSLWFMAVVMKAIQKGDMQALNAFLDRVIGKTPDKLEVTSNNSTHLSVIDQAKLAEALAKLEHDV